MVKFLFSQQQLNMPDIIVTVNPSSSNLIIQTNQIGDYLTRGETGQFYTTSNPSGYITSSSLGSYVQTSQTGNFVTTVQTGLFYPSYNPSGFVSNNTSKIFSIALSIALG
jgi:hypothetical protein